MARCLAGGDAGKSWAKGWPGVKGMVQRSREKREDWTVAGQKEKGQGCFLQGGRKTEHWPVVQVDFTIPLDPAGHKMLLTCLWELKGGRRPSVSLVQLLLLREVSERLTSSLR